MNLDKTSLNSDKIANLYRAAYSLAKGNKELTIKFLENSPALKIKSNIKKPLSKATRLYWAEKLLDQYHLALTS